MTLLLPWPLGSGVLKGEAMKKTTVKKIVLSKETLLSLETEELRAGGGNTGPSCEIFRACTVAGWDC
jgi:hypothetical protein